MSTAAAVNAPAPANAADPQVRGESPYDRAVSALTASVIGAFLVFGWLSLIYATIDAYNSRETAPIEVIEVYGGGGGDPEGEVGETQKIEISGAEQASAASNNPNPDPADYEEPLVADVAEATLTAVEEGAGEVVEYDLDVSMPGSGATNSGKRASKFGTSNRPGYGFGPGDGGVRREERWTIIYPPGQTVDEYARQLDSLKVELGTVQGSGLVIVGNFSGTPSKRTVSSSAEKRLYFLWQGGTRKGSDVDLLARAGVRVGTAPIFQFYPEAVEKTLIQLEVKYRGRQPAEIRSTKFQVVPQGSKIGFKVIQQIALR